MIKVGIIITTRNAIIAFLSFALGAPPPQQDRYLARRPIWLGRQRLSHGTWGGPRLPPRLTPFDRRFWGHASGIPSLLRPIQNSGWSCFRYRSLASFHTRCTACTARLYWRPAPRDLRRSIVPSMSDAPLAFTGPRARAPACVFGLAESLRATRHSRRQPAPSSADHRAAVLDWRLDDTGHRDAAPGPLPWLPNNRDGPKYLTTADTPLFHKDSQLFGAVENTWPPAAYR
jgi:hypothetical protein